MTKRNALLVGTDRAPLGSAVFWKSRFARYFESFRLALATTRSGPRAVIYPARLYRLRKSRACALAATGVHNLPLTNVQTPALASVTSGSSLPRSWLR